MTKLQQCRRLSEERKDLAFDCNDVCPQKKTLGGHNKGGKDIGIPGNSGKLRFVQGKDHYKYG
jgi:hypothetical protein